MEGFQIKTVPSLSRFQTFSNYDYYFSNNLVVDYINTSKVEVNTRPHYVYLGGGKFQSKYVFRQLLCLNCFKVGLHWY